MKDSKALFGQQHLANMREKTLRKTQEHMEPVYMTCPKELVDINREITLTADVMFVNQVPFLITLGWHIGLVTTNHLPRWIAKHIAKILSRVVHVYNRGGFKVQTMFMGNEFNQVGDELPESIISIIAV